jgi:hypothetical protein
MKNIELLDEGITHDLLVVAFDMCSSSKLIEDLSRTNSLIAYDRLLKNLHLWLWSNAKKWKFIVYKFTGDGWILLFPVSMIDGDNLMSFLVNLSKKHNAFRENLVDSHLESIPPSLGLTFGIEMGTLRKFVLGKEVEFAGRALNVACRLQAAVKDKGSEPDYRCLFSRKVFNTYLKNVENFQFFDVERSLRNISDGERYRCVKANLSKHAHT